MAGTPPHTAPGPAERGAGWQVHAALVGVAVIFGGFHVIAKLVLGDLDPFALIAVRVGLATPILVANAWRVDRVMPRLGDLAHLAVLGFFGVFANQLLFINGLERTTATSTAILMPSIPVFAVAVGALLGIERMGVHRTLGILLSAAGALVMVNPFGFSFRNGSLLGNGLILGNCLCFATFLVLQRPILRRLPWRTVIAGAFVFGGAGVLAVAWRGWRRPTWGRCRPGSGGGSPTSSCCRPWSPTRSIPGPSGAPRRRSPPPTPPSSRRRRRRWRPWCWTSARGGWTRPASGSSWRGCWWSAGKPSAAAASPRGPFGPGDSRGARAVPAAQPVRRMDSGTCSWAW